MRKRMLSIWLCLMMVMSILPTVSFAAESDTAPEGEATTTAPEGGATIYVDAINGDDSREGVGTTADKAYKSIGEAVKAAESGDTIKLAEGNYSLYDVCGKNGASNSEKYTKNKDLTFVGQEEEVDKVNWYIGANPTPEGYKGEYDGDYCFDGAKTITFRNLTLRAGSKNYLGFIRADKTIVEDCIINGKTFYWGYTSATFTNTTFNCPSGDYAIWTYCSPVMTFDRCTFNSSGKVINVYNENSAADYTINFNNCTVNNTGFPVKQVLNINDSIVKGFTINITGKTVLKGFDTPWIVDGSTCSRFFGFGGKADSNNKGKTTVNFNGKTVWQDGKMVDAKAYHTDGIKVDGVTYNNGVDGANDSLYAEGYKDNAFDVAYGEWSKNPDGSQSRKGTKTCKYCGQVVTFEETKEADPIDWDVSKSKTATKLDTSTWTSNVTLSLPSAEEALASDVVFVLDKSMSAEWEGQALEMLAALKEQAASTKAKVKVGVVIFNKQANKTAPLTDLATGYDDIQAAIEQTISSGTNTHAGLLAGKQMLDEDTEVAANRKYLIFVSDGITYMYNAEPTVTAWSFFADDWKHWANPENWNSKYGSNNPPDDWSAWMTKIGAQVEAQSTEYEYPYEPSGETATKWTPEDETYKNYANSIDKALYLTYQVYQEAKTQGYNCYAVAKESSNAYLWGPAFMDYLAGGETVNFNKIQNDILYAVSAGSTVTDTIGEKFTFGGVDSFTLKVGTEEIKGVKDDLDDNTVNFGKKKDDGKYPYTVTYAPDTKTFVWTINENVSNFAPVQLTYTVKLTKPETDPGTYGVEDLNGEKELSDAEEEKALFTNESAVLNAINSAGAQLKPLDFPKPSVSYTVKKSSSGGGGGGSHKPTVTIPDDVPTGLNGDDHYAYIVGYPDSTVRPQNGITRAEVATIFFRLLTDETRNANSTKTNSYSDVAAGAWYNHAVSTLSAMGIVKGDSHGKFNPNAPITRAEFAAIAARFDDKANTTAVDFSDIASHWAKDEISAAANNGWINGYTDGTFRPNNKITRAEAMTLVNRVLKRLPETAEDLHNDMIKWSDNSDTSAWYYLAVQEATNSHYYDLKENKHEKWSKLRETRDWTELEK